MLSDNKKEYILFIECFVQRSVKMEKDGRGRGCENTFS